MKYRPPEKDSETYRYSMPSFLWGRRLSQLCKSFEKMKSDEIANCGPLIYSKDGKLKGIINPKFFVEYETFLYLNIVKDLKDSFKKDLIENKFVKEDELDRLNNKLLSVLNSEAFRIARKEENLVLIPTRLQDFNIRISKKHDVNNVIEIDENRGIKTLNPNHELEFHQFFKENEVAVDKCSESNLRILHLKILYLWTFFGINIQNTGSME